MSRIVVMGSGETAPTMVKVHREIFAACPPGPAAMLDTPFAFQMNREELVTRTRGYFADSVGCEVEVAVWSDSVDPATKEKSLALLDRASWAFAGPGSPTYALRHWRGTPLPATLSGVVRRGGTLVLGSAAAVTLGTHAVPVYEIYKVGADPEWVEALDLLGELTGVSAVVIPHYDNKEGATHDTRFCYLGEQRLAMLEELLPAEVGVIGVDEHTAIVIDVAARTIEVLGNGQLSVRRRGATTTFGTGHTMGLDELSALLRGERADPSVAATPHALEEAAGDDEPVALSLRTEADRARTAFDAAIAARDVDGCLSAVLDLEEAIASWRADTLQSDDMAEARRVLRALVVRLSQLAESGAADPAERVRPYVEALLELRRAARETKDFATSDLIRDRLADAGVEVRDAPEGSTWALR